MVIWHYLCETEILFSVSLNMHNWVHSLLRGCFLWDRAERVCVSLLLGVVLQGQARGDVGGGGCATGVRLHCPLPGVV